MKPLFIGLGLLVMSGRTRGADPTQNANAPERLLPASAQVYVRWDGVAAHREQYARTAIGQLLMHDLAPLRKELLEAYPKLLRSELTEKKLLEGLSPQKLAKIHAAVGESSKLADVLLEHGVVAAAEISPPPNLLQLAVGGVQMATGKKTNGNPMMPRVRVTLVIPNAAAGAGPILSAFRLLDTSSDMAVKEETVAGRKVLHVMDAGGTVHSLAWVEGPHVVISVGTELPAAVFAKIDGAGPRLDSHRLYKRLNAADGFETDLRAFVDVKSLVGMSRGLLGMFDPAAAKKIDALGLTGLHAIVLRSGFDGPQLRQVIEVDAPGPRQGVLRLAGGKAVTLDQLPPLPPDVSRWSAHRLDPAAAYDVATQLFDLTHPPDPGDKTAETAAQQLDRVAGIDLKADLLPYLGDTVVAYTAPSEGLISFGQVVAVQVKDADRVLQAIDQIVQTQAGGTVRVRKRPVADGEVREIYVRKQGFFFTPSYAVYKGWLVASLYPQPVQAFVQRAGDGAKPWEPDAGIKASLAALPKNATGLAVADARPSIQTGLTFSPFFLAAAQGFGNGGGFEVGTLPSASVVNQRLSPTVTALSDDGSTLRWESRGSLLLPGDSLGLDPILLLISAQIFN